MGGQRNVLQVDISGGVWTALRKLVGNVEISHGLLIDEGMPQSRPPITKQIIEINKLDNEYGFTSNKIQNK